MSDVPIIHHRAGSVEPSFPEFQLYEKKPLTRAKRMPEPFSAETPHGVVVGGVGDYLVVEKGALWVIPQEVFEALHRQVDVQEGETVLKELM